MSTNLTGMFSDSTSQWDFLRGSLCPPAPMITLAVYCEPSASVTVFDSTSATRVPTRYSTPLKRASSTNSSSCATRSKTTPSNGYLSGFPEGGTRCISVVLSEIASSGVRRRSSMSGTSGHRRLISSLLGTSSPHCRGEPIGSLPSITRTSAPPSAA